MAEQDRDYTEYFKWMRLAEKIKDYSLRSNVQNVIMSAEQNARETIGEAEDRSDTDFAWLFHESICCVSTFDENPKVQKWFEKKGYRW